MVSPTTGIRGAHPTRSIFRLPITTILSAIWFAPVIYKSWPSLPLPENISPRARRGTGHQPHKKFVEFLRVQVLLHVDELFAPAGIHARRPAQRVAVAGPM